MSAPMGVVSQNAAFGDMNRRTAQIAVALMTPARKIAMALLSARV